MSKTYYWYSNATMLCGRIAACSGLTATTTSRQRQLRTTAPTGSLEQTIKVQNDATTHRGHHLQTEAAEPGIAEWAAGDWTVKLKTGATGGNNNFAWKSIHICRANAGCTTYTTVASSTFTKRLTSNATVYQQTISGASASSGASTDTLYVVLGFRSMTAAAQTITLDMLAGEVLTPLGIPQTISPNVCPAVGASPSPTIALTLNVAPSIATAVGSALDPSVALSLSVLPSVVASVGTSPSPTLDLSLTVSPSVAASVGRLLGLDVAIGPLNVSPAVAAAAGAALAPTVASALTVSPNVAASVAASPAPGLALTLTVAPSVVAAVASSPSPEMALGALLVQPSVAAAVAAALAPLIVNGALPAEIVSITLSVDRMRLATLDAPRTITVPLSVDQLRAVTLNAPRVIPVTLSVDRSRAVNLER